VSGAPERKEFTCREEIKQGNVAKVLAREWAREEAEGEVEAAVAGPVRAETAFVRTVGRELLTNREIRASNKNAPNAERLWHGSNQGSS
jgi:hypothetical protein